MSLGHHETNEIVVEQPSPDGNVTAIVEQDERCAYLYLFGPKETFGTKACWVRNVGPAPQRPDLASMREGRAPMLHAECCSHPQGSRPLQAKDLRILWFEEGDAAVLFEHDQLLGAIPGWSGCRGFKGYARDCTKVNALIWPLLSDNQVFQVIPKAERYWAEWDTGLWKRIQPEFLATVERFLGREDKYYAIDGGKWPPKAIVRIRRPEATFLLTIGVSLRAQPTVDQYTDSPGCLRRIELAMALSPEVDEGLVTKWAGYLSTLSAFPWTQFTWLGTGHTVGCGWADFGSGAKLSAVLLAAQPPGVPRVAFAPFQGDPINVLWLMPITANEKAFAESHQSGPLMEKLARMGVTGIFRPRPEANDL